MANTTTVFATTTVTLVNNKPGLTTAQFNAELREDPNKVSEVLAGFVDLPIFSSNLTVRIEPTDTLVLTSTNPSEVLHYAAAGSQLGLTVTLADGSADESTDGAGE